MNSNLKVHYWLRQLLYAVIGVEVLVLASKQLFARLDFQSDKGLESAYSVEKLGSFVDSTNFGKLRECNPLFLLGRVSAESSENRRKEVFQQNRPRAVIPGSIEKTKLMVLVFEFDEDDFHRFITQVFWQMLSRIIPCRNTHSPGSVLGCTVRKGHANSTLAQ